MDKIGVKLSTTNNKLNDTFKFTARTEYVLNNIFQKFPRIAKAFRVE